MNMLRPISRKYDLAEHEYPKELDMLAAMIDGLAESGASEGAGAAGVRRGSEDDDGSREERHQPRLGHVDPGDVLGRRRAAALDAAPGTRQLRHRVRRRRRAARALRRRLGRHGDHRARAPAPTRPTSRPPRCSTATSTSSTARRSTSPPATAPTTSWCGRPSTATSAGRRSSRSSSPKGTPGHAGGPARAQARHPGLRHRDDHLRELPGAEGEPPRLGRGRPQAGLRRRDGDLRQHPPAGRGDGGRLRARRRST